MFVSYHFTFICVFVKCVSLYITWLNYGFSKIHFANLYLLIRVFSPFTFNVITDKIGFMSATLIFGFYIFFIPLFLHYCIFFVC